jgi:beta-lactam-binding protein with PASTA domain
MNASRVLLISLLMLTGLSAKPLWAQDSSNSAAQNDAASPVGNTTSDVSPDWRKEEVKVPNVVGLRRDEAVLDLFKAGLRIGDVREETSTSVADHHVISESPAAGTEAKGGSTVDLVIARAPEVKVPDVVGLTLSAAKAMLDKVDLNVGRIEERPSTTVAAGLIISQHPRAGTMVREDRRVRLVMSKGTPQDTVPNVIGATQAAAATAIASAGLTVGTVTSQSSPTVAAGIVINESPSAGSSVAAKSAVNLVVSSGPAKVAVPNVVGLTQATATTAITGAGLTVGTVAMQSSATVAAGLVIGESPAAGTSVASGSAVSLVISSGLPLVAMPNVVGLTQTVAATAITGVGLKVGVVTMQSSATVAAGLVITESPSAGTSLASGSAVNLVVSSGGAGTPNAIIDAPASVLEYATVLLNASYSTDPTATIRSYAWKQLSGPSVTLTGATTSKASFTAPLVTSQTSLVFALTITDTTGAISTANTTVTVSPAAPSQLQVSMVSALLFRPNTGSAHAQFALADGPPLAGSSSTLRVAMAGAVQSPTFTLVDVNGNALSTLTLSILGAPSNQPTVFVGPIVVPTVPFRVSASGTTANAQAYAVQSATLFSPMNMSISFSSSRLLLTPGTSGADQLTIYNGGSAATFNIVFSDPNSLLASQPSTSVQIGAASSLSVPVTVAYPATPASLLGPTVTATASVSGDATRTGTATLTVWDSAQ